MKQKRLKAIIIGFGRIARGTGGQKPSRQLAFNSHAQVLSAHEAFDWCAVVDPDEVALESAREQWNIPHVYRSIEDVENVGDFDIAVVATPPDSQWSIVQQLSGLRAVLIEKPLGVSLLQARALVNHCARKQMLLQVNFLRRADQTTRCLQGGLLEELLGGIQVGLGFYTNGLVNNGSHLIDLGRMLFNDEVRLVEAEPSRVFDESPLPGDINIPFSLEFECGSVLRMNPLRLTHFRENGLEIWGEKGRLSYLRSGLSIMHQSVRESSIVAGEYELGSSFEELPSTMENAFFEMYSNLANAVLADAELISTGASALKTFEVVECVRQSAECGGRPITCSKLEVF